MIEIGKDFKANSGLNLSTSLEATRLAVNVRTNNHSLDLLAKEFPGTAYTLFRKGGVVAYPAMQMLGSLALEDNSVFGEVVLDR